MAERYGKNPHVAAWQTDNEYACHDTTLTYSTAALHAFRDWLAQRYQSPDALNRAWGNVFWSMDYASFDEIGLPNLTVTEANPAHVMAFRRFASDMVVQFNRVQTEIEQMEAQLKMMNGQIEYSVVRLSLSRAPVRGPLGFVFHGIGWVIEKLFVIRE